MKDTHRGKRCCPKTRKCKLSASCTIDIYNDVNLIPHLRHFSEADCHCVVFLSTKTKVWTTNYHFLPDLLSYWFFLYNIGKIWSFLFMEATGILCFLTRGNRSPQGFKGHLTNWYFLIICNYSQQTVVTEPVCQHTRLMEEMEQHSTNLNLFFNEHVCAGFLWVHWFFSHCPETCW